MRPLSEQEGCSRRKKRKMIQASNKTALVTGAGSGIGRNSARALAREGYRVALVGRRESALRETAALDDMPASQFLIWPADISDPEQVTRAFEATYKAFGHLDVMFNNAGAFDTAPFDDVSIANWKKLIDVNLNGAFYCAQAAYRLMKRQRPMGGRIINNGSISAYVPRPHAAGYTVSKHAITGLTKQISLEGRAFDIACGQIDIGNVTTDMTTAIAKGSLQADGSLRPEPVMHVDNVVKAILFMANLPLDTNVQFMTVMATTMPFIGRG